MIISFGSKEFITKLVRVFWFEDKLWAGITRFDSKHCLSVKERHQFEPRQKRVEISLQLLWRRCVQHLCRSPIARSHINIHRRVCLQLLRGRESASRTHTRTRYDVCRVMAAIFLWIPGFHYRPALCIRCAMKSGPRSTRDSLHDVKGDQKKWYARGAECSPALGPRLG